MKTKSDGKNFADLNDTESTAMIYMSIDEDNLGVI